MNVFDKAKIVAEIAEMSSRIYGLLVDKGREIFNRDQKIKELESKIAALEAKLK